MKQPDSTFKAINAPRPPDFDAWFACFKSVVPIVHAFVSSQNVRSGKHITQSGHFCQWTIPDLWAARVFSNLCWGFMALWRSDTSHQKTVGRNQVKSQCTQFSSCPLGQTAFVTSVSRGPAVLRLNHLVFAQSPGRSLHGRLADMLAENTSPSHQLGPRGERSERRGGHWRYAAPESGTKPGGVVRSCVRGAGGL